MMHGPPGPPAPPGALPSLQLQPSPFEVSFATFYPDAVSVRWLRGREAVNELYRFEVGITCHHTGELDAQILGRPATVLVRAARGVRALHGVVARVRAEGVAGDGSRYYVVRLVPRLALGRLRRASRIFQDASAVEVVTALATERGVPLRLRLAGTYPKRAYVVQHRETDVAFVARLCAEEGIFFYFDHPADAGGDVNVTGRGEGEVLVLSDTADYYAPLDGGEELAERPHQARGGLTGGEEAVERFAFERRLRPTAAVSRRYDFRRPLVPLTDAAGSGRARSTRLPIDASYFPEPELEEARPRPTPAVTLLDELRRNAACGQGESSCPRLAPGRRMVLREALVPEHAAAYAVRSVEHDGVAPAMAVGRPTYQNRFTCVPAAVPLRPRPPRPRLVQVLETATVVGPAGEEIHTDEHGRVKLRFHWDLEAGADRPEERSSAWVRVAQAWAGTGFGAQVVPRVGMEVIVGFLGGDPDEPVVAGCLYNATHPPPYPLPAHKTRSGLRTRSSPGGEGANELFFEDGKGQELFYLQAERDRQALVKHDDAEAVVGEQVLAVGQNRRATIGKVDELEVGERHIVRVKEPSRTGTSMDDEHITQTTGGATMGMAGGDASLKTNGNASIDAGGDLALSAAGNVNLSAGGDVNITAGGTVIVSGGASVVVKGADVIIIGGTVKIN